MTEPRAKQKTKPEKDIGEFTNSENDEGPSQKTQSSPNIKTFTDACVEMISGVADLTGTGVRRFGEVVTSENAVKLDRNNGLVKGVFEATASALEDAPDVIRRTYHVLSDAKSDKKDNSTS